MKAHFSEKRETVVERQRQVFWSRRFIGICTLIRPSLETGILVPEGS